MSAREPRFEVVRSDAGWFARFRAANGRIVWVTESFTRKRAADRAIVLLVDAVGAHFTDGAELPAIDVDERTAVTA